MADEIAWISITGRASENPKKSTANNTDCLHALFSAAGNPLSMFFPGNLQEHAEHIVAGKIYTFAGTSDRIGTMPDESNHFSVVWSSIDFISPEDNTRRKTVGGLAIWHRATIADQYQYTFASDAPAQRFNTPPRYAIHALINALPWDAIKGKIVLTRSQPIFNTTIIVPNLLKRK